MDLLNVNVPPAMSAETVARLMNPAALPVKRGVLSMDEQARAEGDRFADGGVVIVERVACRAETDLATAAERLRAGSRERDERRRASVAAGDEQAVDGLRHRQGSGRHRR